MVIQGDDSYQEEDPAMFEAKSDPFFTDPTNTTRIHHRGSQICHCSEKEKKSEKI